MSDGLPGDDYDEQRRGRAASELNGLLSLHGWGLRRHVAGEIVVTHKDGSGVLIREDAESIAETLFYRMMDNFLTAR